MQAFAAAGAGFLLAVLWFDLMFDVQVLRHAGQIPAEVLDSISAYYRRVTTDARPMNRLVAVAMLGTLAALVVEVVNGHPAVGGASLVLAATPITLAGVRTVPTAVRLGARRDPDAVRAELAKSVCRDHIFCTGAIASVLVVQLVSALT
ncbi:MAG: hypothetical protein ACYDH6_09395 [Acidimicrobiales bacterium]